MTEYSAAHFEDLCSSPTVRTQIDSVEPTRRSALKRFWLLVILGLAASVAAGFFLGRISDTLGVVAFVFLFVGTIILAFYPLAKASDALKQPVLEGLAERGNLTYAADGFEPPLFASAAKALFGGWLSRTAFTDLFTGADAQGRNFAVYEATLERGQGKSRQQVFSGQIYAFERLSASPGVTVVVPDRGLFNFFKPAKGMERVKFEQDAEFEKRFEVYSDAPGAALALLGSSTLREQLLRYRGKGKLFLFVGPGEALVAVTGANRFEPGSMFKSIAGEQRARRMFDELCESLQILKVLKDALD